ncbi:MAG: N-6 DNA methylase [Phycisphaerales bacterium]
MSTEPSDIAVVVQQLLTGETSGVTGLATRIGVNPATISRWQAGEARPRPELEGKIRSLAAKRLSRARSTEVGDGKDLFAGANGTSLDHAFVEALHEVREALHRHGRLSSRHEALDELAKLVFAHFASIETNGNGVAGLDADDPRVAECLRDFVEEQFRLHLPTSVAHEFAADDFRLRIKPGETRLAQDLIACFRPLTSDRVGEAMRGARDADLLNDTFGRFLADSFTDEKELGQYLTPPEVVRAMTRIGLASLSDADRASLMNPEQHHASGLILDPSCGVGSFLAEAVRQLLVDVEALHSPDYAQAWLASMNTRVVVGMDKSERMLKLALTSLALFGAASVNLHLVNSLSLAGRDGEVTGSFANRAKLILTNPPFGAEFSGQDLRGYALGRVLSAADRTVASELLFIERYLQWLAPGGVLVAIVPDSVLTNRGMFRQIRDWVAPQVDLCSVISLPPVTFGVAGTNTKTSILHLRKRGSESAQSAPVYFGVCNDLGFEVVSRGSQRRKVRKGENELPAITEEAIARSGVRVGQLIDLGPKAARWDATFHSGLPLWLQRAMAEHQGNLLRLSDVADVVNDRCDPRRLGDDSFRYIEISDVVARDCTVFAKEVATSDAPSRARKLVRAGDVLLSMVRPDRKTVGAVPSHLDGAVCSTGLAVIRPHSSIDGASLARLFQTDFVNLQLLRNNIGIAYPAIDEDCLADVVLPLTSAQAKKLKADSKEVQLLRQKLSEAEARLVDAIGQEARQWAAVV